MALNTVSIAPLLELCWNSNLPLPDYVNPREDFTMSSTRSARLIYGLIIGIAIVIIGRNLYKHHLNNSLIVAVKARNVAEVRALLNRGADPNTREHVDGGMGHVWENSMLGLLYLNQGGNGISSIEKVQDIACLLIERSENIRDAPKKHQYFLIEACQGGLPSVVTCLLQHGANANVQSQARYGPVEATVEFIVNGDYQHSLAQRKQEYNRRRVVGMEIIGLLEQKGAHLTPWQAIRINDMASLRAALDKGIDVEARETIAKNQTELGKGKTLLQEAVKNKNREAVQILLQHGASINSVNNTDDLTHTINYAPFVDSIALGDKEMFHLLLAHGADVNGGQDKNNFPLQMAVGTMPEVVPELLQHGADLKQQGVPALRQAINVQGFHWENRASPSGKSPGTKKAPPLDLVALLLHGSALPGTRRT